MKVHGSKNQIIQERKVTSFLRHLCALLPLSTDVATLRTFLGGPFRNIQHICRFIRKCVVGFVFFTHNSNRQHTLFVSLSDVVTYCCVTDHPKLSVLKQPPFIICHHPGLARARSCVFSQLRVGSVTWLPLAGSLTWRGLAETTQLCSPWPSLDPGQPGHGLKVVTEKQAGSRCVSPFPSFCVCRMHYCPINQSKSRGPAQSQRERPQSMWIQGGVKPWGSVCSQPTTGLYGDPFPSCSGHIMSHHVGCSIIHLTRPR